MIPKDVQDRIDYHCEALKKYEMEKKERDIKRGESNVVTY
jgi:hypothetical protein